MLDRVLINIFAFEAIQPNIMNKWVRLFVKNTSYKKPVFGQVEDYVLDGNVKYLTLRILPHKDLHEFQIFDIDEIELIIFKNKSKLDHSYAQASHT